MSLTWKEKLEKRGVKTSFLLEQPGLKLFPLKFSQITNSSILDNKVLYGKCSLTLEVLLYLNMNTIFSLRFSIEPAPPDLCGVNINIFPLFEYGYEESMLPPTNNITVIWNEKQLIAKIIEGIQTYQSCCVELFPDIEKEFMAEYNHVKSYVVSYYGKDFPDENSSNLLTEDEITDFTKFFKSLEFYNEVDNFLDN